MYATVLVLSTAVGIGLDQLLKSFVVARFSFGRTLAMGWVEIRSVLNHPTYGSRKVYWIALLLLETVWLVAAVQLLTPLQNAIAPAALGAALGGATSNVIDRIWRGAVIDYIDVNFWPVFNLADAAIVLGVVLALMSL